jgi:serine/threonine protein kinase
MSTISQEQADIQRAFEQEFKGTYEHLMPIGEGGTSYVWRMKRVGIPHTRVLKVLKPLLHDIVVAPAEGDLVHRTFQDLFAHEAAHILTLQHPNIIKLFDANVLSTRRGPVSWYAMEDVAGASDMDEYLLRERKAERLQEHDVIRVFRQAAEGLAACHSAKVIHADIKPANIMVGASGDVRLVDFGFAKSVADLLAERKEPHSVWISDRRYMHPELLELLESQHKAHPDQTIPEERTTWLAIPREQLAERGHLYDLYALGRAFEEAWNRASLASIVTVNADFVRRCWQRLKAAGSAEAVKYESARQLAADLEKASRGYSPESVMSELNAFHADSIRLPSRGRVPLTERLSRIIDEPWFQRLRSVRQLGPVHLIYPGAVHTRFEHCLGVFEKTTYYLRALWGATGNQYFKQSATEQEMAAVLVAALLHDVGHYPFAHAFEEVEPNAERLMKHASISTALIRGQLPNVIPKEDWERFRDGLWSDWRIEVDDVAAVLDLGVRPKNLQLHLLECLHSIVDGPLDADKLDYLVRDGHHCGSPYGSAIDEEKFLQSLIAPGANQTIGIREKGLVAAEAVYLARYHMFVTVYWHHMTRACERMVSEGVRILREQQPVDFGNRFYETVFNLGDEALLNQIGTWLGGSLARDLIAPLQANPGIRTGHYRRLLTLAYGPADSPSHPHQTTTYEYVREMFDSYMSGKVDAGRAYRLFEAKLRLGVLRMIGDSAKAHHVLLDVPDPRIESPLGFFVYTERQAGTDREHIPDPLQDRQPVADRSTLHKEFLQDWKRHARKIRIYVVPTIGPLDVRKKLDAQGAQLRELVTELARDIHTRASISEAEVEKAIASLPTVTPTGPASFGTSIRSASA